MGFELRLYVGLSVPNGRGRNVWITHRLNPVLFENRIHHPSSDRAGRLVIKFDNTSLRTWPRLSKIDSLSLYLSIF